MVLASRGVTIHSLEYVKPLPFRGGVGVGAVPKHVGLDETDIPHPNPSPEGEGLEEITLIAQVSKGTYIRSLARDIALALGTVGHVTMLRRTKAGPFDLSQAISLDNLAEFAKARTLEDKLLPLRAGLDDIPALSLSPDQAGLLRQGRVLIGIAVNDGPYFAMLADMPVALVEVQDREVRVVRGFNL